VLRFLPLWGRPVAFGVITLIKPPTIGGTALAFETLPSEGRAAGTVERCRNNASHDPNLRSRTRPATKREDQAARVQGDCNYFAS